MKTRIKYYLDNNTFLKNVILLVGGTSFGQLIAFISSPILTRIYSPEDFGILGTFTAIFTVLVVFGSLRIEMAIPIPEKKEEAIKLVALSLYLLAIITLIISLLLIALGGFLAELFRLEDLRPFIWLIPFSVIGVGVYQILEWWTVRQKSYAILSRTKVTQSITMVAIQVIMGLLSFKPIGLLIGSIFGYMGGNSRLLVPFIRENFNYIKKVKFNEYLLLFKNYAAFSRFSLGSGVLNSISQQMPVILLGVFYGIETAGFFALTLKIIGMPTMLISKSVGKVYIGEASSFKGNDNIALKNLFINTTRKMILIGIVPFAVLGLIAPSLFSILFGNEWIIAGEYLRLLLIMYFFQFVISPVAQTMIIFKRAGLQFYYDIIRFIFSLAAFLIPSYLGTSVTTTIFLYSIVMAITYLINLLMNYFILKGVNPQHGD